MGNIRRDEHVNTGKHSASSMLTYEFINSRFEEMYKDGYKSRERRVVSSTRP